ncbi:hypothetical protein HY26_03650 [Hyphomonas sp. GM-8P]|nr:hypothetical protein HY26_03650 [Hyphomonas sp. GM-8P]
MEYAIAATLSATLPGHADFSEPATQRHASLRVQGQMRNQIFPVLVRQTDVSRPAQEFGRFDNGLMSHILPRI